jgi:hypothetical protein
MSDPIEDAQPPRIATKADLKDAVQRLADRLEVQVKAIGLRLDSLERRMTEKRR